VFHARDSPGRAEGIWAYDHRGLAGNTAASDNADGPTESLKGDHQ
jgi:hypothetical protein